MSKNRKSRRKSRGRKLAGKTEPLAVDNSSARTESHVSLYLPSPDDVNVLESKGSERYPTSIDLSSKKRKGPHVTDLTKESLLQPSDPSIITKSNKRKRTASSQPLQKQDDNKSMDNFSGDKEGEWDASYVVRRSVELNVRMHISKPNKKRLLLRSFCSVNICAIAAVSAIDHCKIKYFAIVDVERKSGCDVFITILPQLRRSQ